MLIKNMKPYLFYILLTVILSSCTSLMVGSAEIFFPITGTFELQNSFNRNQNGIIEIMDVNGNNFSGYLNNIGALPFLGRININGSYNRQSNISTFTCIDNNGQEWTFRATMARGGRNFYRGEAQLTQNMNNGRFQTREINGRYISPSTWQAWLVQ